MENIKILNDIMNNLKTEVKLADLTRKDFKGNEKVLNKYFVNNQGYSLNRFRIPKENIEFKQQVVDECNKLSSKKDYKNLNYLVLKALKNVIARELGYKSVSTVGLSKNDEDYKYYSWLYQEINTEDDFRETDMKPHYNTMHEALNSEIYSSQIDLDTKDKLYNLIYLAIKQRLVMLLGLENIVPLVSLETFDNVHSAYNSILNAYRTKILKLCKDKEVNEFIKKYNDIEIYAKDENFKFDYVNTYSKILRQLTDIRDEKLEYVRSIIHNDEDILEEEILSNQSVEIPVSEFIVDTEEDC